MKVFLTTTFEKTVKKLHKKEKIVIEDAIDEIIKDPTVGESKVGDLAGACVYKFFLKKQKLLLAYKYISNVKEITLLDLSSHENFYRNLKNRLR